MGCRVEQLGQRRESLGRKEIIEKQDRFEHSLLWEVLYVGGPQEARRLVAHGSRKFRIAYLF